MKCDKHGYYIALIAKNRYLQAKFQQTQNAWFALFLTSLSTDAMRVAFHRFFRKKGERKINNIRKSVLLSKKCSWRDNEFIRWKRYHWDRMLISNDGPEGGFWKWIIFYQCGVRSFMRCWVSRVASLIGAERRFGFCNAPVAIQISIWGGRWEDCMRTKPTSINRLA